MASLNTADGWWGMVTWYTCSEEGGKGGRERRVKVVKELCNYADVV